MATNAIGIENVSLGCVSNRAEHLVPLHRSERRRTCWRELISCGISGRTGDRSGTEDIVLAGYRVQVVGPRDWNKPLCSICQVVRIEQLGEVRAVQRRTVQKDPSAAWICGQFIS